MHIEIRSRNYSLTPYVRTHVERRVHYAFDRILSRIKRVEVRLADVNGPRGGRDKQCVIGVHVAGGPGVTVREEDSCVYRAVDKATGRIKRHVKELLRERAGRRRRRESIRFREPVLETDAVESPVGSY